MKIWYKCFRTRFAMRFGYMYVCVCRKAEKFGFLSCGDVYHLLLIRLTNISLHVMPTHTKLFICRINILRCVALISHPPESVGSTYHHQFLFHTTIILTILFVNYVLFEITNCIFMTNWLKDFTPCKYYIFGSSTFSLNVYKKTTLKVCRILVLHLLSTTHTALGLASSPTFPPLLAAPFVTAASSPSISPSSPLKVLLFFCVMISIYIERERCYNKACIEQSTAIR